jgi:hypothetical protein
MRVTCSGMGSRYSALSDSTGDRRAELQFGLELAVVGPNFSSALELVVVGPNFSSAWNAEGATKVAPYFR